MGLISNNVNINVIVYSLCLLAPSSPVHAARELIYCYVMMLFFGGGGGGGADLEQTPSHYNIYFCDN